MGSYSSAARSRRSSAIDVLMSVPHVSGSVRRSCYRNVIYASARTIAIIESPVSGFTLGGLRLGLLPAFLHQHQLCGVQDEHDHAAGDAAGADRQQQIAEG